MEVAIVNFTLPAMYRVVCTLVATGIPSVNVTDPVPAVDQTPPPPSQHQLAPLPEGYVAYPDIGFAYKLYNEKVTWNEALSSCLRRGARLALIDSTKKIEYVKNQGVSSSFAHVGIIRSLYNSTTWVGVATGKFEHGRNPRADNITETFFGDTGLPVGSLPWRAGNSAADGVCVQIDFSTLALFSYACQNEESYLCEIPVLVWNNTLPAN